MLVKVLRNYNRKLCLCTPQKHNLLFKVASTQKVIWWYNCVGLEITWLTKILIYALPQCLWLSNVAGRGYGMRNFLPESRKTLWSGDVLRSREIWTLSYLYYSKSYGHETWWGGYLQWEVSIHNVTKQFEYVVM